MTQRPQTWDLLEAALRSITYSRDEHPLGRRFNLVRHDDENFAVLYIFTYMPDSYAPAEMRLTRHEFVVPVATYHQEAWTRWVFDRFLGIEQHEACESFKVDGLRVYAPHHGNGEDPYAFWPGGTREQKRKHPGED